MKLILNIFFSLICCLSVLSPVSAEEKGQFVYTGPLDPLSVPMLLDASTIIEFDNSNMCTDWATLTTQQQETILSNIGLNNYNLAVLTTDNVVYLGKAIWCSSYSDGSYKLHSQSNVDNPGFYLVGSDGSLTKDGEIQTLSFKSIFYSLYDVGSIWFEYYDIKTSNCEVPNIPVVPPSLELPTPNTPNYSINTDQNTLISNNGTPGIRGGQIYSYEVAYFNIYSVVQTAETDQFFSNRNNNYYAYQLNEGKYIFPVYQYSELYVYAPNMSVSGSFIPIEIKHDDYIPGYSYVILGRDSNVIQRDVSQFHTKYVDKITRDVYSFEQLPFSNDVDNENHLEYLGVSTSRAFNNFRGSSISVELTYEHGGYETLYFVVTDKYETYQDSLNISNQITIDNNMNSNFTNLDNTLQHGNALTQGSKNDLDIIDNQFNNSYDRYQAIEQGLINDYNNNLDSIDLDTYKISNNLDLINTANFVRTQFDRLTLNNPIGLTIGFSLCVGLALLLIGKRL